MMFVCVCQIKSRIFRSIYRIFYCSSLAHIRKINVNQKPRCWAPNQRVLLKLLVNKDLLCFDDLLKCKNTKYPCILPTKCNNKGENLPNSLSIIRINKLFFYMVVDVSI